MARLASPPDPFPPPGHTRVTGRGAREKIEEQCAAIQAEGRARGTLPNRRIHGRERLQDPGPVFAESLLSHARIESLGETVQLRVFESGWLSGLGSGRKAAEMHAGHVPGAVVALPGHPVQEQASLPVAVAGIPRIQLPRPGIAPGRLFQVGSARERQEKTAIRRLPLMDELTVVGHVGRGSRQRSPRQRDQHHKPPQGHPRTQRKTAQVDTPCAKDAGARRIHAWNPRRRIGRSQQGRQRNAV